MDYNEFHLSILQEVNNWLRFAEAKNALLIGFSGAYIAALLKINFTIQNSLLESILMLSIALSFLSVLAALFSFFPFFSTPKISSSKIDPSSDNLLYFGHAQNYSPSTYSEQILKYFKSNQYENYPINDKISHQIITNSRITVHKLRCFEIGLGSFFVCVVLLGVALILK